MAGPSTFARDTNVARWTSKSRGVISNVRAPRSVTNSNVWGVLPAIGDHGNTESMDPAALSARHQTVIQDQIRHGFQTRQPYDPPAGRAASSWANARRSGLSGHEIKALGALARQDRIRLRALCAALRALRYVAGIDPISGWAYGPTRLSRR